MRGVVGVMNELDQIGDEAVAVNIKIDQGSEHQNKKK